MTTLRRATRPATRLGLAVVTLTATVALSSCSVAGTSFHPGVAARVGDATVTADDVDRLAVATCSAFADQFEQGNQVVPLRLLKGSVVQALTLDAAARQFGDDYGVTPSAAYTTEVDSTTNSAGDLPADQVEAVVLLRTSTTLINDVLGQVGAQIAAGSADGADSAAGSVKGAAPTADSDQAITIGGQAFGTWLDDHDIEIDPQYDVEISSSGPAAVDTSISFAVGDAAKAGSAAEPDQATTMALPASQRCGTYSASGAAPDAGGTG